MATGISEYYANKLLEHALGKTEFTMPTIMYLAAFDGDPLDAGSEIATGAYARQQMTISAAAGAIASNGADITFPEATGDWGTVSHLGVFYQLTEGTVSFAGTMDTAKAIATSDQLKVSSGNFGVQFS